MEAKAAAAEAATAAAEAKLAGQGMAGRGYMERMALLKSQLRDLQQRLDTQVLHPHRPFFTAFHCCSVLYVSICL